MRFTATQKRVLAILRRAPGATARQLADQLGVPPNRVHNTLNNLLRLGYVTRTRTRPMQFTAAPARRKRLDISVEADNPSGLLTALAEIVHAIGSGQRLDYSAGMWTDVTGGRYRAFLEEKTSA